MLINIASENLPRIDTCQHVLPLSLGPELEVDVTFFLLKTFVAEIKS